MCLINAAKGNALQRLNPDYKVACFHVFLRVQLWNKAIMCISWQGELSLEIVMPWEVHTAQAAFVE